VYIDPTTHKSGVQYQWIDAPWDTQLADLPTWVADAVKAKAGTKGRRGGAASSVYYPPMDIDRSKVMERARAYINRMPDSIQGQRGSAALMAVCGKLVQGFGLLQSEVWPIVCEYNQRAQPAWTDREMQHKLNDAERSPDPGGRPRGYMLVEGNRRDDCHLTLAQVIDLVGMPPDTPPPEPTPAASSDPSNSATRRLPPPAPEHRLADTAGAACYIDAVLNEDRVIDAQAERWTNAHAAGPGIYLDQYPPTDAALTVRRTINQTRVVRSLTVLQANDSCHETAADIAVPAGLDIATYPARSVDNCQNMSEVKLAEAAGLSPTAAVCQGCPHNMRDIRKAGITAREMARWEEFSDTWMAGERTRIPTLDRGAVGAESLRSTRLVDATSHLQALIAKGETVTDEEMTNCRDALTGIGTDDLRFLLGQLGLTEPEDDAKNDDTEGSPTAKSNDVSNHAGSLQHNRFANSL
jgi:hypothetical protein